MFSREARVRLFLALLILVLVLTNSQSLQVSYQSRGVLTELFESRSRETALRIVTEIGSGGDEAVSVLSARLENLASTAGSSPSVSSTGAAGSLQVGPAAIPRATRSKLCHPKALTSSVRTAGG